MDENVEPEANEALRSHVSTNFSPFEKGKKFSSYSEFLKTKERYENTNYAVLVTGRSKKLPAIHKCKDSLVYSSITFECKKGKGRLSAAKGLRPNVKTGKLGCTFHLKLNTIDGFLVVKESNLEHLNHELSEERFRHLPENLRLNPEDEKRS